MGLTLFWLKETGFAFPAGARAAFISDALAAWLTGEPLCADPSNADSSGLFDAQTRRWNLKLIERLGLPVEVLPPIRSAPAVAGWLRAERAQEAGLRAGLPVSVSVGDNQASFIGSVADYAHSLALNIGTGGQLSAYIAHYLRDEELETRCFPGGGYILVSAGLCGGRSYAILRDFYRAVGVAFFGARGRRGYLCAHGRAGCQHPPRLRQSDLRAALCRYALRPHPPGELARAVGKQFRSGAPDPAPC